MSPMTHMQFRKHLQRLRLTQTDFGRLIGSPSRSIRRYASGESAIRQDLAMLIKRLAPDDDEVARVRSNFTDAELRVFSNRPPRKAPAEEDFV